MFEPHWTIGVPAPSVGWSVGNVGSVTLWAPKSARVSSGLTSAVYGGRPRLTRSRLVRTKSCSGSGIDSRGASATSSGPICSVERAFVVAARIAWAQVAESSRVSGEQSWVKFGLGATSAAGSFGGMIPA